MVYNGSNDVVNKFYKFNLMCGTIRRTLKSPSKGTRLKFYKVMAFPTLLYGSENWTLTKGQASHIQAVAKRFLRHIAGYTLHDHKRNMDIRQELNIISTINRIPQYRLNWWEHLCRMDDCRVYKQLWSYKPRGRRGVGRPRKRWSDQL